MVSTINPRRCLERCLPRRAPNCPEEDGPDYDIGAAPILTRDEHGKEVLLVGQKSGMVYALILPMTAGCCGNSGPAAAAPWAAFITV